MTNWIGNSKKYYVDQQLPNYNQIANQVQAQFPHLRVGIGPASLNDSYLGADKQQIEDFIAGFDAPLQGEPIGARGGRKPPTPPHAAAPPAPEAGMKTGDAVLVSMVAIGEVEARFVRALPNGLVLVDLDGVEEEVDPSTILPFNPNAVPQKTPPAPRVVPPAGDRVDAASPEPPKAAVAPPEPPKDSTIDEVPPEGSQEPPKAPDPS